MAALRAFAATLAAVTVAELGDKTQLLAVAIAARARAPIAFAASTLGFVAANLLMIPLGALLHGTLTGQALRALAGALFLGVGLLSLLGRRGDPLGACSFVKGFCAMFLAELGDKTNLTTLALAASTGAPAEVALGVAAAAAVLMATATALGSSLAARLPADRLRKVVGALFAAVGAAALATALAG